MHHVPNVSTFLRYLSSEVGWGKSLLSLMVPPSCYYETWTATTSDTNGSQKSSLIWSSDFHRFPGVYANYMEKSRNTVIVLNYAWQSSAVSSCCNPSHRDRITNFSGTPRLYALPMVRFSVIRLTQHGIIQVIRSASLTPKDISSHAANLLHKLILISCCAQCVSLLLDFLWDHQSPNNDTRLIINYESLTLV